MPGNDNIESDKPPRHGRWGLLTRIKGRRYQELSKPYRIVMWMRWMPYGYIKGLVWYFVKRLRWENVCDCDDSDELDRGRISLETCISMCVGIVQVNMNWYFTIDEVFRDDGSVICSSDKGCFDEIFNFIENKLVEIIDGN